MRDGLRHLRGMSFPATLAAPSLDDFALIARAAFDDLPEPFRQMAGARRLTHERTDMCEARDVAQCC